MELKMVLDHVSIVVDDVERSVQFYNKILGMPIEETVETQETKTVFLNAGSAMISLTPTGGEKAKPPSTALQNVGLKSISFRVRDVEEAREELLRRGVIFTSGPETVKGGYKKAMFTDPNGVTLEVVQWPQQQTIQDPSAFFK